MRNWDADAVARLGPAAAAQAIIGALVGGLDPAQDRPRSVAGLANGQLLLMPAESPTATGVKVVTIAPANPARGLPRIHAQYLLFDRTTLAPVALLDGTALTTLRTPAVSVAAVLPYLPDRPLRLAVIGGGPQAVGHVAAFAAVRPLESATYLVRDLARAPAASSGSVSAARSPFWGQTAVTVSANLLGSPEAARCLQAADVVVCATTARTPVLDGAYLRSDAVVVAVGSHEPDARELGAELLGRSTVVVEDVATALREAGDVVLAIAEGQFAASSLIPMRDVVLGVVSVPRDRPLVFKSVGMAWQDLAVAEAVVAQVGLDP